MITRLRTILRNIVFNGLISSTLIPSEIRWFFYRIAGLEVQRCGIQSHCFIGGTKLRVERAVFINHGAFIDAIAPVSIGTQTAFGMNVSIITTSHEIGSSERRAGRGVSSAVTIGRGVWIGAGSTICPGVNIGDGVVIGAGSLVLRDCEPDSLYVGRPANLVRRL
ncbi:DapH/DapD/GlmU-related protein [Rhodococcoides fascians]|uniref:DapH/DapD/GlmU-related protein n=1 Tax=Rhodococcoides fascians TaxID=1828 RepID=UPI002ACECD9D|nr:DapH/DapD/GlmU-related protein [Rhodococcus fascians]WQH27757.1 DapH/DapD/GlmU-related protein [Rhodococcus fascians]